MKELQQPSSFRPFMWELRMFFIIARRTSQHDIRYIIPATSHKRYHMVNMILMPPIHDLKLRVAARSIVASVFLPLQLLLNLSRSILAPIASLASAIYMNTFAILKRIRFDIRSLIGFLLLLMHFVVQFAAFPLLLSVYSVPRFIVFEAMLSVGLVIGLCLFLVGLVVHSLLPFYLFVMGLLVCLRSGIVLCALLRACVFRSLLRIAAFLTFWVKSGALSMKKLCSYRQKATARASTFLARGVILGYSAIHSNKPPLQVCCLDMQGVCSALHIEQIFPHFTAIAPLVQLQEAYL